MIKLLNLRVLSCLSLEVHAKNNYLLYLVTHVSHNFVSLMGQWMDWNCVFRNWQDVFHIRYSVVKHDLGNASPKTTKLISYKSRWHYFHPNQTLTYGPTGFNSTFWELFWVCRYSMFACTGFGFDCCFSGLLLHLEYMHTNVQIATSIKPRDTPVTTPNKKFKFLSMTFHKSHLDWLNDLDQLGVLV